MGKERNLMMHPTPFGGKQAEAWGMVRGDHCHLIGRQIPGGHIQAVMAPVLPAPPPPVPRHGRAQRGTQPVPDEGSSS